MRETESHYEWQDDEEQDDYEDNQGYDVPLLAADLPSDPRHMPADPNYSTPKTGATPKIKIHTPSRVLDESPTYKKTNKYRKLVGSSPKVRTEPDWVIGGNRKDKPPRNPEESQLHPSTLGENDEAERKLAKREKKERLKAENAQREAGLDEAALKNERLREAERKLAKREKRERLKADNAQKEADLDEAIGTFSPMGAKQPKSPPSKKSTKASKKSTPASVTTGAKPRSSRGSQCSTAENESEEASATSHLPK
jgi:hypothetical protein